MLVGVMATVAGKHASSSTEALQRSMKEVCRKTEEELENVVEMGLETMLQIIKMNDSQRIKGEKIRFNY